MTFRTQIAGFQSRSHEDLPQPPSSPHDQRPGHTDTFTMHAAEVTLTSGEAEKA